MKKIKRKLEKWWTLYALRPNFPPAVQVRKALDAGPYSRSPRFKLYQVSNMYANMASNEQIQAIFGPMTRERIRQIVWKVWRSYYK